MRLRDFLVEYVFHNEVNGFSHGQMDGRIIAYQDASKSEPLGYVDYARFGNKVHIQHIKALKAAPMLGIQLLKFLKTEFPRYIIDPGMTTDDGGRLLDLVQKRHGPIDMRSAENARTPEVGDVLAFMDDTATGFLKDGITEPVTCTVTQVDGEWVSTDYDAGGYEEIVNWYYVDAAYMAGDIDIHRARQNGRTVIQIKRRDVGEP